MQKIESQNIIQFSKNKYEKKWMQKTWWLKFTLRLPSNNNISLPRLAMNEISIMLPRTGVLSNGVNIMFWILFYPIFYFKKPFIDQGQNEENTTLIMPMISKIRP